jgi:hypothetical protein
LFQCFLFMNAETKLIIQAVRTKALDQLCRVRLQCLCFATIAEVNARCRQHWAWNKWFLRQHFHTVL